MAAGDLFNYNNMCDKFTKTAKRISEDPDFSGMSSEDLNDLVEALKEVDQIIVEERAKIISEHPETIAK